MEMDYMIVRYHVDIYSDRQVFDILEKGIQDPAVAANKCRTHKLRNGARDYDLGRKGLSFKYEVVRNWHNVGVAESAMIYTLDPRFNSKFY